MLCVVSVDSVHTKKLYQYINVERHKAALAGENMLGEEAAGRVRNYYCQLAQSQHGRESRLPLAREKHRIHVLLSDGI